MRYRQPRAAREHHVEQHEVGAKTLYLPNRGLSIRRFANDREARFAEQSCRQSPEARMIVDDKDAHDVPIVAPESSGTPLNSTAVQGSP